MSLLRFLRLIVFAAVCAMPVFAQLSPEAIKQAETADAKTQYEIGMRYLNGDGVPKDQVEALRWIRIAADRGYPKAQTFLGHAYARGTVAKDKSKAVSWYRKAAEQGDAEAQLMLGMAYANGEGIPKDPAEASRWIQLSGYIPGAIINKKEPKYPKQTKRARIQGTVVIRAVVTKDGHLTNLAVVSGPPELVEPSLDAIRQWRYRPFTLRGEPIEMDTQVSVNFALSEPR